MDSPMRILVDALSINGWEWDEIVLITAGLLHPEASLDMAKWVVDHPKATWQELMKENSEMSTLR